MRKLLLAALLLAFIMGCDKKESSVMIINSYPTTIGSEWTYRSELIVSFYESEISDEITGVDTIVNILKIWVDKDTLLNDSIPLVVFKSKNDQVDCYSVSYNQLTSDGFRNFAYANAGCSPVNLKNATFNMGSLYFGVSSNLKEALYNQIFYREVPVLHYPYPLTINSSWTFLKDTYWGAPILKHVTDFEPINAANKIFNCFKINWDYGDVSAFSSSEYIDWIAAEGLVKSEEISDRILLTNVEGEPSGYVKVHKIITLIDFNIN